MRCSPAKRTGRNTLLSLPQLMQRDWRTRRRKLQRIARSQMRDRSPSAISPNVISKKRMRPILFETLRRLAVAGKHAGFSVDEMILLSDRESPQKNCWNSSNQVCLTRTGRSPHFAQRTLAPLEPDFEHKSKDPAVVGRLLPITCNWVDVMSVSQAKHRNNALRRQSKAIGVRTRRRKLRLADGK